MEPAKILIVDDEEEFASTVAERLNLRGYHATAVFSANEALAIIRTAAPDVVLLDLMMPGINGLETLRVIKATTPAIEVIILTGYGGIQGKLEGMESGAFDYVMKPVDLGVLITKIEMARSKRKAG